MSVKDLYFTVLGPSGAGKTTLLASMNRTLSEVLSGAFYQNDSSGVKFLEESYKAIEDEANSSKLEFGTSMSGTQEIREYHFTIGDKNNSIQVHFYDFPGGWLDSNDGQNHQKVVDIANKSDVIMAVINMPYIRAYNGKYTDHAKINEIQKVIKQRLEEKSDRDKLILLVPMKTEAYIKDVESIYADIERLFHETIELAAKNKNAAIGIVPVQTIGNAKFSMFDLKDESIVGEIFRKPVNSNFAPENTDQPLRLALSFFMSHYELPQDLNNVLKKIQANIKPNKFKILSGNGLINGEGISNRIRFKEPATAAPETPEVILPTKPETPKKKIKTKKKGNKYKIAIMGASGAGKTIFLGSYFNLASRGQAKYTIAPISQESVDRMKELYDTMFVRKEPVIGTSERVNLSFSVSDPNMEIELDDLRGGDTEDMNSWDAEKITSDLVNADGALFFISGEDLVKNPERVWSSNMVFSSAISKLREQKLADIPIIFIITKGDTIPDVNVDDLKKRIAALIKRAATSPEAEGMIERNFFRKGQRVSIYKTTAMGKWPSIDKLPDDYEPKNVIEPMDELIIQMHGARAERGTIMRKIIVGGVVIAAILAECGAVIWDRNSWGAMQRDIESALTRADYPAVQRTLETFKSPSLVIPFFRTDRNINEGYAKYEAALYPLVQADIAAVDENVLPPIEQVSDAIKRVKSYLDVEHFAVIAPEHYEKINSKKWYFSLVELFNYDVNTAASSPVELMKIILRCLDQDIPDTWRTRADSKIEALVREWCKVLPVNVEPNVIESYIAAADSLILNSRISDGVKRNLEAQKNTWGAAAITAWNRKADDLIRNAGTDKEKAVKTLEQELQRSQSPIITERIEKTLVQYYLELVNQWLSEYRQDTDVPRLKALMNSYPGMTPEAKTKLSAGIEELDKIRLEKAASLLARSRSLEELSKEAAKLGSDTKTEIISRTIVATTQSLMKDQLNQIREVIAGYNKDERFSDGRKKLTESCNLLRNSVRPLTASDPKQNEEMLSNITQFEQSLTVEIENSHYNACRQEFNRKRNTNNTNDIAICISNLNDFTRTWPSSQYTNTVKQVLDFLTTIQNGVSGSIYIGDGDFSGNTKWIRDPEMYVVIDSQRTRTIRSTYPNFNERKSYEWKVSNSRVSFAAYQEGVFEDTLLLSEQVSVSGFFGYRNLTKRLGTGRNGLNIRFEASIPKCPWE